MDILNTILGVPLGYIIYYAYQLTNNYGIAILIFTLITKVLVFPVSSMTHRNSIKLLKIQPKLSRMKKRWASDKERLNEEQYKLFKDNKYNPFVGIIPLFIQLILVMGIIQVMYNPLEHILHLDNNAINVLIQTTQDVLGVQGGYGEQLNVIEAVNNPEYISVIKQAVIEFPNAEHMLQDVTSIDLRFLGINLGQIPALTTPDIALTIPIISGLSALAYCLLQSAVSPGALSQSKRTNRCLTITTVALSTYFTLVTPLGIGVYWIFGNILSMINILVLRVLYNPEKLAGDAIAQIKAERKTSEKSHEVRLSEKELRAREKQDAIRFSNENKQLVFYAITSGQYKYYKKIIEYILKNSSIVIHYLTNDPNDSIFMSRDNRLIPYYSGERKTISLMLKLDCDILVTTVPDLQNLHIKRSIVRDDIEYIYIPHGLLGGMATLNEKALDYYNTVFCTGQHRADEVRRREEIASLPPKKLVKVGYGVYDQLVEAYAGVSHIDNERLRIIIAPSWQDDNILEMCVDDVLHELLGNGYEIIIRPHPQFTRLFPEQIESLRKRYSEYETSGELVFGLDFFNDEMVFTSDILITDWSNIAYEFAFVTFKPSIFINTPMKVLNQNYKKYGLELLDITLRDKVGISVGTDDLGNINDVVVRLRNDKDIFKMQIEEALQRHLFYPGRSGEAGGKYIINQLKIKSGGGTYGGNE